MWRAAYAPGDCQTSLVYSSQPVQYLYINQLLSINKLVLSYLLLRLLPQWWPRCDARGGHGPTVAAASAQRSRSPAPSNPKRADKRSSNARTKVAPLPAQIFIPFKTLEMACVNFTIIMAIRLTGAFRPVLGRKTSTPPNHLRFGSQPNTRHCLSNAFPRNCRIDISRRQIDKW